MKRGRREGEKEGKDRGREGERERERKGRGGRAKMECTVMDDVMGGRRERERGGLRQLTNLTVIACVSTCNLFSLCVSADRFLCFFPCSASLPASTVHQNNSSSLEV